MSINGDLRMLLFTGIASTNILFNTMLFAQDSYSPPVRGGVPGKIQHQRRVSRRSSVRHRPSGFRDSYLSFSFATGKNNFSSRSSTLHTGFSYSSSKFQYGTTYNGTRIVPACSSPSPVITFGLEYGRRHGSFYGYDLTFTQSGLPNPKMNTGNNSVDLKYGYNFILSEQLWIRPVVLMGFNYLRVPFVEEIDNTNLDLYIFGKTFAYQTKVHSRYNSYNDFSPVTTINFYEVAFLPKFQLEMGYQFSRVWAVTVSAGYCWTLSKIDKIEITNKHQGVRIPVGSSSLDFSSTLPVGDVFNYSGMYVNVGVTIRLPP